MKVLHTSDLHSELMGIVHNKVHMLKKFDVWMDTGDFMPNDPKIIMKGRDWDRVVDPKHEAEFQRNWLWKRGILDTMVKWLNGRPFISVQGNHDFISLVDELKKFGYKNAHEISPAGFELDGYKFAGFPNINFMAGEWNHETKEEDFDPLIEEVYAAQPDVLVTHSPPHGVLDIGGYYRDNIGVGHMMSMLCYKPHKINYHFFGHVHEKGGHKIVHPDLGITFINGARCVKLHEI